MSFEPDHPEPSKLADALRAAYSHKFPVPPRIDDAVLSAAHDKFERRRRTRMLARWGTGLAAGLAAAIALAVILHRPTSPAAKSLAKGDLNADGRLNMVDALSLARHLAAGDRPDAKWDITADGTIDAKDVDAIATAAVRLDQSGVAQQSLPKLQDLSLHRLPVGLASASGTPREPKHVALAEPPTTQRPEAHP